MGNSVGGKKRASLSPGAGVTAAVNGADASPKRSSTGSKKTISKSKLSKMSSSATSASGDGKGLSSSQQQQQLHQQSDNVKSIELGTNSSDTLASSDKEVKISHIPPRPTKSKITSSSTSSSYKAYSSVTKISDTRNDMQGSPSERMDKSGSQLIMQQDRKYGHRLPSEMASLKSLLALSGKTPSSIANEVIKKTRNATFATKVKNSLFTQVGNEYSMSEDDAKEIFMKAIASSQFLSQSSQTLKEELFRHVVPIHSKKGDMLFKKGNMGQIMFIILSGKAQARRKELDGSVTKFDFQKGSVLADYCVMMNVPHEYSVIVSEPGLLLGVHRLQYQMAALNASQKARKLRSYTSATFPSALLSSSSSPSLPLTNDDGQLSYQDTGMSLLRGVPLFSPLTDEQLISLSLSMKQVTFAAGQRIISATEKSIGLFVIIAGEVILRTPTAQTHPHGIKSKAQSGSSLANPNAEMGMRKVSNIFSQDVSHEVEWLGPGDYFSEASLVSSENQPLGVDAVASEHEPVRCLMLPTEDFQNFDKAKSEKSVSIRDLIRHEHIVRLLGRNPIFAKFTEDQLHSLPERISLKQYSAGDAIIKSGLKHSDGPGIFIIIEGLVKVIPDHDHEHHMTSTSSSSSFNRKSSDGEQGSGETSNNGTEQPRKSSKPLSNGSSSVSEDVLNDSQHSGDIINGNNNQEEVEFAVLLAGDSFGEDSIMQSDGFSMTSFYAIGGVTCGVVSREILSEMNCLDIVIMACKEENEGLPQFESDAKALCNSISEKLATYKELYQEQPAPSSKYSGILDGTNGGSYKILRFLHQKETTNIYIAIHKASNELAVIKSIKLKAKNKSSSYTRNIFNEQTILTQLNSPFIVHMISGWEEPELKCIALEVALGGDLGSIIDEIVKYKKQGANINANPNDMSSPSSMLSSSLSASQENAIIVGELGCLDFESVRFFASCIVLALKHIYEHRVCHRDIKPQNFILDHHGYIKLSDFGDSIQFSGTASRTKTICGTPSYMAPEIVSMILGKENSSGYGYGYAVDWWSFGISLYEMANGFGPFDDDSPFRTRTDTIGKTYPSPLRKIHKSLMGIDAYQTRGGGLNDEIYVVFKSEKKSSSASMTASATDTSTDNDTSTSEQQQQQQQQQQDEGSNKWMLLKQFINRLLATNPSERLGATSRGPREAMICPLFQRIEMSDKVLPKIDWEKLMKRGEISPFHPWKLLMGVDDVKKIISELETTQEQYIASQQMMKNQTSESEDQLEIEIRNKLESDRYGFMGKEIERAERIRAQELIARKQQLKRVLYKQGKRLSDLDADKKTERMDRKILAAKTLQKSAKAETVDMASIEQTTAEIKQMEDLAARIIQHSVRKWKKERE